MGKYGTGHNGFYMDMQITKFLFWKIKTWLFFAFFVI